MTITLEQLGEQYIEQSEILRRRVDSLRPQLKMLKGRQLKELEKRIFVLYDNAHQLKTTGLYLKNYYTGDDIDYELKKLLS
ncbi:MAG: hypothetical protein UHN02_01885 [Acutalibacteraceae bacterium]|nr:hypothetical protein [Acutalibacteraceae bacterium]